MFESNDICKICPHQCGLKETVEYYLEGLRQKGLLPDFKFDITLCDYWNPETSLKECPKCWGSGLHGMYADAEQFFKEATYPTDGLKNVLSEVFARLKGDNSVPAIHRLETAFGGGKTHTLIACTHIGYKGKELESATANALASDLLPEASEVTVVGIQGTNFPCTSPKGPG